LVNFFVILSSGDIAAACSLNLTSGLFFILVRCSWGCWVENQRWTNSVFETQDTIYISWKVAANRPVNDIEMYELSLGCCKEWGGKPLVHNHLVIDSRRHVHDSKSSGEDLRLNPRLSGYQVPK
jgi:hypothetical protein